MSNTDLLADLNHPITEIEKAELAQLIRAAGTSPDGKPNVIAAVLRRLIFQHGQLEAKLKEANTLIGLAWINCPRKNLEMWLRAEGLLNDSSGNSTPETE